MCERLSNATRELLAVHQKLYQTEAQPYVPYPYDQKPGKLELNHNRSRSPSSHSSSSFTMSPVQATHRRTETPPLSSLLGTTTTTASESPMLPPYQQQASYSSTNYNFPISQQRPSTRSNEIDFNSLEFLYDTGLFGQVVFDANNSMPTNAYSQQSQSFVPSMMSFQSSPVNTSINTPNSAFQTIVPPSSSQPSQSPTTFNANSKSLWS